MISKGQSAGARWLWAALIAAIGCGDGLGANPTQTAIIDPPAQCSPDRPDCSLGQDFPDASDLDASNSAGVRFSPESDALVIDRARVLPDVDADGVPDDADACPGTPDWRSCDGDPTNDGLYATLFYDPSGSPEAERQIIAPTVADIPAIDVYFLIDATPSLAEEIAELQAGITTIIDDIRLLYGDARFGVGFYRAYPLPPLSGSYSQSPYHHLLDLTDDDALIETAVSTLNAVANMNPPGSPTAATQALYSIGSGLGLGDMVPNRGECPDPVNADIGFPCFRQGALHVVLNITDAEVYNGPRLGGPDYGDPPSAFDGTVGAGADLPPLRAFPGLLTADGAPSALDLGDLSGLSLTLMGMSTLFTDDVKTVQAAGCIPPPPMPPSPPGMDDDGRDAVLTFRFDSPPLGGFTAVANNTHWPAANVALFDDPALDPLASLACDGQSGAVGSMWGGISWTPPDSRPYYLVIDELIPTGGMENPGAFSISISHDGDPATPAWRTTDAPVSWNDVETALLASQIRVASVVTPKDSMTMPSDGNADARLIGQLTAALTKSLIPWVTELPSEIGEGLDAAVSSTVALAKTDSVYDIEIEALDDDGTGFDERSFVKTLWWDDCSVGEALECGWGAGNRCRQCDVGAAVDFDVFLSNTDVAPTTSSQVFEFELLIKADDAVEVERIPVRILVPDDVSHEFDTTPEAAFYRNVYDSTARCITPPERPKWGDLTWTGATPNDTTIVFQIRTAPTLADLATAMPAVVEIPTDTTSSVFNIRDELIADGQPWGLPYLQITAVLNPGTSPPTTPTLEGWTFEFVCEAAE